MYDVFRELLVHDTAAAGPYAPPNAQTREQSLIVSAECL